MFCVFDPRRHCPGDAAGGAGAEGPGDGAETAEDVPMEGGDEGAENANGGGEEAPEPVDMDKMD